MAPFAALFCVVVCSSFTVSLACEGSGVQQIVSELGSVDWKVLAGWLDVGTDGIEENCLKQGGDLATCYRRSLVKRYCEKTDHSPRQVADDMANVLENHMRMKKQANKLRQLTFTGSAGSPSADHYPPSPSDSTTHHSPSPSDSTTHHSPSHSQKSPQPTGWVSIGVALTVVAVTTCIITYLIYTRAGPVSGVPPAGVTSPGVPPPGVTPPGVTSPGVPPPGVSPSGITSPGVPPARVPPAAHTIHPGYERVRRNMVDLVTTLKSNSAARHKLTLYYKEHAWLDITEYPTEYELVTLVLTRIKQDPSQYDRFVDTLRAIEGMDLIVNAITAEPHHSPTPDKPTHDATVEPPELPDLLTELDEVAHRWKIIGLALRLSYGSIERISADNHHVRDCMREMLSEWQNRESSPTWQTVVEALKSGPVKELRLARDIEQKYILN